MRTAVMGLLALVTTSGPAEDCAASPVRLAGPGVQHGR